MKHLVTFLLFLYTFCLNAQNNIARNTIYAEGWGNGLYFSINYDRIVVEKKSIKWSARAGLTYSYIGNHRGPGMPLEWNMLLGKKRHYLEFGTGLTYILGRQRISETAFGRARSNFVVFGRVGYRYQPIKQGVFIRAGYTPAFIHAKIGSFFNTGIASWGAIALGYSW